LRLATTHELFPALELFRDAKCCSAHATDTSEMHEFQQCIEVEPPVRGGAACSFFGCRAATSASRMAAIVCERVVARRDSGSKVEVH
jgi:hypothetical protein